jgi:hypothetical protein
MKVIKTPWEGKLAHLYNKFGFQIILFYHAVNYLPAPHGSIVDIS